MPQTQRKIADPPNLTPSDQKLEVKIFVIIQLNVKCLESESEKLEVKNLKLCSDVKQLTIVFREVIMLI